MDAWGWLGLRVVVCGGKKMKRLARTYVIVAACLAMANVASALNPLEPFVNVTVPDGVVDLGDAAGPGWKKLGAQVVANVVANCPYRMEASFQGFTHARGIAAISPEHMLVQINGREVPVGTGGVEIAASRRATRTQGVDVPVNLQVGVTGLNAYPAGRYNGALVIRVMALP